MKILICGKGGCGKSTIAAMLGKYLAKKGLTVLVVDADESNVGLYRMLGLKKAKTLAECLGGREGLRGNLSPEALPRSLEEIPAEAISRRGNIAALSIGKIEEPGEGCACPYGLLAREFLKNLKLREDEAVLVDTEAGIEHFGRGLGLVVDRIVNVAEPNVESIMLSQKIQELSAKAGIRSVFVLNKSMPGLLDEIEPKPDLTLPFDQKLLRGSLVGEEVTPLPKMDTLWEFIHRPT
ncbi:MAG: Carbon monoxide dehydrogenase accessory CooC-like protein [Acetothermia bacterium 64_32]|nr:MAG: Carbon monoxide dehydrogenase accessory CooC-like protein [Acetothermia bacterium 64_32]HAF71327.1 carbon monoxide dehydrogenase [Candidatus Acetothermia bacterium]